MLVWLVFLSALAIVSHQQFQHRRLRQPFWLPNPSHHALPNYRPNHYEVINDNAGQLTPRQEITVRAILCHQNPKQFILGTFEQGPVVDGPEIRMEDERIINRSNLRFLFYAIDNNFFKTATMTITTTQDVTRVQTCINVDRFVNLSSISVICKRKKREILQDSSGKSSQMDPISIEPSNPQQPLMTIVPVVGQLERETRHQLEDPELLISSSKDDVIIGRDESTPGIKEYPKKQKRFYYPFVETTTVHSFVLNSFVITKTIRLAYSGDLICRPSEFVVCST